MEFIQKLKEKPTCYIVVAVILALCVILAAVPGGIRQAAKSEPKPESETVTADNVIGEEPAVTKPGAEDVIVVLDPGHDTDHSGARSSDGTKEESLNLKIANYCKEELESYPGVTVYMTRTSDDCPITGAGSDESACLEGRVDYAESVEAAVYVSIHLNWNEDASLSGTQIYIPNPNYDMDVYEEALVLADDIMAQLNAVGLDNKGIYSQDSGRKFYPDGSAGDYWSVIYHCKLAGIPGVIVEHAFMSNESDLEQYLYPEEGLKTLGAADAAGIAEYLGLKR